MDLTLGAWRSGAMECALQHRAISPGVGPSRALIGFSGLDRGRENFIDV